MEKTLKIWMGMPKGDILAEIFSEEELKNIDLAVDRRNPETHKTLPFYLITNYNENSIFGEVQNWKDVAEKRGIKIVY